MGLPFLGAGKGLVTSLTLPSWQTAYTNNSSNNDNKIILYWVALHSSWIFTHWHCCCIFITSLPGWLRQVSQWWIPRTSGKWKMPTSRSHSSVAMPRLRPPCSPAGTLSHGRRPLRRGGVRLRDFNSCCSGWLNLKRDSLCFAPRNLQ